MSSILVCPFCYDQFDEDYIQFRCENPDLYRCPEENDPRLANYFMRNKLQTKRVIDLSKATIKKGERKKGPYYLCDKCKHPSRRKICPECHNDLPVLFHTADSHIISIIGARGSGKTHFITVLIHELMKQGHKLKISIQPQDLGIDRSQVTSIRYKRDYKIPLVDKGELLPMTPANTRDLYPLIYRLESDQITFWKSKSIYLAFYDTAGENFRDAEELKRLANYIVNSSGIIFLLDTFKINKVKRALRKQGKVYEQIPEADKMETTYYDVYYQVRSLLEREGLITNKRGKTHIPMAVTFSKIDEVIKENLFKSLILNTGLIKQNSSFLKTSKYSRKETNRISEQMIMQLKDWDEEALLKEMNRTFKNLKYFGVSALGDNPVDKKLVDGTVSPLRVLDPLLWILDELHFALPVTNR